jgi:ADP-ribose pyrophosphatase
MPVLAEGRYIRLRRDDGGWEWCERVNSSGVVVIVAVTPDDELLLVEQPRRPVGGRVLELPAGLAGDLSDSPDEAMATAAQRELEEETGWRATSLQPLTEGPVSAGMSSEILTWFRATGLSKVGPGGGDDSEDIEVFAVPLAEVEGFVAQRESMGVQVDAKVFAGLYFARRPATSQTHRNR